MKKFVFISALICEVVLHAQTGVIGHSDLTLNRSFDAVTLDYNVSMALGYRTNCPQPTEVLKNVENGILTVHILFDGTGFNPGCGCESKNEVNIKEEWYQEEIKEIHVISDLLLRDIHGGVKRLVGEDTHVLYQNSLGAIEVYSDLEEVKLFPNPTKDVLNIEIPSGVEVNRMYLSAANGVLVRNLDSEQRMIEVSGLPQGTYYLWLIQDGNAVVRSFVVNK